MIYRATVSCSRGYGTDLPGEMQKMGFDRIKLHEGKITAEYKVGYRLCDNGSCLTQKEIKGLKGGGDVDKVDFSLARRWRFIYPFYELWWKIDPKSRREMAGYMKVLEDNKRKYLEQAGQTTTQESPINPPSDRCQ